MPSRPATGERIWRGEVLVRRKHLEKHIEEGLHSDGPPPPQSQQYSTPEWPTAEELIEVAMKAGMTREEAIAFLGVTARTTTRKR